MTPRSPAAAALVAAALLVPGCGTPPQTVSTRPSSPRAEAIAYPYHGLRPQTPVHRPAFSLTDTSGRPFDFGGGTAGQATLLFFGYTHCPDECPTTMAAIAASLRQAGPDVASRVRVVFVTTDPARDSGPVLRGWLDHFDAELPSRFTGLTGTPAQVHAAETASGVPLSEAEQPAGGGYGVAHAALVLAYAVDDRAHVLYPAGTTVATYVRDLRALLARQQPA